MPVIVAVISAKFLPAVWFVLAFSGVAGLLALFSPTRFTSLALRGSRWVDSSKALAKLDKRWDLDEHILPHARWLGVAVIAAVAFLGWLLLKP